MTIKGSLGSIVGPRSFTLSSLGFFGSNLLVVSKNPLRPVGGAGIDQFLFTENDVVKIQGVVKKFNAKDLEKELGVSLSDQALSSYEGKPVIIAEKVQKENPADSSNLQAF